MMDLSITSDVDEIAEAIHRVSLNWTEYEKFKFLERVAAALSGVKEVVEVDQKDDV